MAHQPGPPNTRQSGPEAKKAPEKEGGSIPHGGPIKPNAQGFVNPGPTNNLRGVEPNTAMHRGTPNPDQKGSDIRHGDHEPGMGQAGEVHGHGVHSAQVSADKHSDKGTKSAPPAPDPRGVRK